MLVYNYTANYNKTIGSIAFEKYNEANELSCTLSLSTNDNGHELPYYVYSYDDGYTNHKNKMLLSMDPFIKPLDYFDKKNSIQIMNITNSLNLKNGFSIQEEIPFGFISIKDENNEIISAKKYGLKDNKIPDYSDLISEYKVINNLLIVYNRFMESYNYIASGREIARVMTQDNLCSSKIPNIFFVDAPKTILIADKGNTESEIFIEYDDKGLPNSFKVNGEEKCEYIVEENRIISKHPLYWEPFDNSLYKDILVDKVSFEVCNTLTIGEDTITFNRIVDKK